MFLDEGPIAIHRTFLSTEASGKAAFEKPMRAVRATESEIARNPRSRSAVLRAAVRTAAPARPESERVFA